MQIVFQDSYAALKAIHVILVNEVRLPITKRFALDFRLKDLNYQGASGVHIRYEECSSLRQKTHDHPSNLKWPRAGLSARGLNSIGSVFAG